MKQAETRNRSLNNSQVKTSHFRSTSKALKIDLKNIHQVRFDTYEDLKPQKTLLIRPFEAKIFPNSTNSSKKPTLVIQSSKSTMALHSKTKSQNMFLAGSLMQQKAKMA